MSEEVIHRTFYNKEYNVEFYNTPKAGMTTMLRTIPLEFQPLDGLPPKRKVCCVLRDPVSRFISGFGHLGLHGSTDCKIREWNREGIMGSAFLYARVTQATRKQAFFNYLHEIELNGFFDHHHLPQHCFLNGLHPSPRIIIGAFLL